MCISLLLAPNKANDLITLLGVTLNTRFLLTLPNVWRHTIFAEVHSLRVVYGVESPVFKPSPQLPCSEKEPKTEIDSQSIVVCCPALSENVSANYRSAQLLRRFPLGTRHQVLVGGTRRTQWLCLGLFQLTGDTQTSSAPARETAKLF